MTKQMRLTVATLLLVGAVSMQAQQTAFTADAGSGAGQTTAAKKKPVAKKKTTAKAPVAKSAAVKEESTVARELRELKAQQAAQQTQLDEMKQAAAAKDAALADAQQATRTAEAAAQAATTQAQTAAATAQTNADAVTALKSNVTDLQTTNAGLASTISATKVELNDKIDSPASIHYRGVTITPVAFFAFEGVYRQRALNSDINTPFNSIPFGGSNEAHVSELNFTARQSRLGGLFEGNTGPLKLSGYFEADFLSAGTTSNSNQSNSYTLRQRQFWGKAETKRGFAVTGGQMWSLVTETGKSTDARTEKLPNTIDSQYMVGYNWTRQPGIRFQQKFVSNSTPANVFTVAMSLEQAQTQLVGANLPGNFVFGGAGNPGGLFNPGGFNGATNYANNIAPDVIVKVALDTRISHMEFGGIARFFRDEVYPLIVNPVTGLTTGYSPNLTKDTKVGGGAFGSARVTVNKYVDVALQAMGGQGVGRYGSSQLGDVTAHPDGTLEPLRNYHGEFSLETHPTKKLDAFAYYGAEYEQREYYRNSAGALVGYGAPNLSDSGCSVVSTAPGVGTGTGGTGSSGTVGPCQSPTRLIQEGMVGFIYRIVNSPKYGRLQYSATYSYLTRSLWSGVVAGSGLTAVMGGPKAVDNMVHFSMRYYIP